MPCPDVHPPAYAVPNPTRNPPPTIIVRPRSVSRLDQLTVTVPVGVSRSKKTSAAKQEAKAKKTATRAKAKTGKPAAKKAAGKKKEK